jgi:hypothetical protein
MSKDAPYMTKASLDLEVAHHYRPLNCFAKHLTSTGHLEVTRLRFSKRPASNCYHQDFRFARLKLKFTRRVSTIADILNGRITPLRPPTSPGQKEGGTKTLVHQSSPVVEPRPKESFTMNPFRLRRLQ